MIETTAAADRGHSASTLQLSEHLQAEIRVVAISQEERAFFVALGTRIAQLRKSANITQLTFRTSQT